jgi:hypothetical protein
VKAAAPTAVTAPVADDATLSDDQLALVVGGVGGDNPQARALLRALAQQQRQPPERRER